MFWLIVGVIFVVLAIVLAVVLDGWKKLIGILPFAAGAVLIIFNFGSLIGFIEGILPTKAEVTSEIVDLDTAEEIAATVTVNSCPTESMGTNPANGEPLMFAANPYPGVLCEYEAYSNTEVILIKLTPVQGSIVADWAATCATGPRCEGTWVATGDVTVVPGILVHMYVYASQDAASARFLGNQSTGEGSFACEYVATPGHTVENIRIPSFWTTWKDGEGSIFEHAKICP